ncbi:MAG: hypothetical protein ACYCPW_08545 [Nitrososphaerales archaeon]
MSSAEEEQGREASPDEQESMIEFRDTFGETKRETVSANYLSRLLSNITS